MLKIRSGSTCYTGKTNYLKKKKNNNIISNVFEFNPINSACQSWDYVNLKMFKRSHKQ